MRDESLRAGARARDRVAGRSRHAAVRVRVAVTRADRAVDLRAELRLELARAAGVERSADVRGLPRAELTGAARHELTARSAALALGVRDLEVEVRRVHERAALRARDALRDRDAARDEDAFGRSERR